MTATACYFGKKTGSAFWTRFSTRVKFETQVKKVDGCVSNQERKDENSSFEHVDVLVSEKRETFLTRASDLMKISIGGKVQEKQVDPVRSCQQGVMAYEERVLKASARENGLDRVHQRSK